MYVVLIEADLRMQEPQVAVAWLVSQLCYWLAVSAIFGTLFQQVICKGVEQGFEGCGYGASTIPHFVTAYSGLSPALHKQHGRSHGILVARLHCFRCKSHGVVGIVQAVAVLVELVAIVRLTIPASPFVAACCHDERLTGECVLAGAYSFSSLGQRGTRRSSGAALRCAAAPACLESLDLQLLQ